MPLIQAYRQAYPQASDDDLQRLIACDAFMRRAAQVPHPLILKGSYLTRQYFPDTAQRLFADFDFVLQPHYDDIQAATRRRNLRPLCRKHILAQRGLRHERRLSHREHRF